MLHNSRSLYWIGVLTWFLVCFLDGVMQQVSLHILFGFLRLVGRRMQHFNNQSPKIKSGNSVHSQTCTKRDNLRFRWTVRNRSFFLTHPTCGNERVTSKYAQNFTRGRFWVFKISVKVRVLEQSQPALLCSVSHMTIVFKFTCVMSVRDQTRHTFVTSFCPCRYRTSKFVYRPLYVRSTSACQI